MTNYNMIELYHHGIKGMKWGVRRFQNKDGSLTKKGGMRYNGRDYEPRVQPEHKLKKYTSPILQSIKSAAISVPKSIINTTLSQVVPGYSLLKMAKSANDIAKYNCDGKDYTKKEGSYEKLSDLKKKTSVTDVTDDLKNCNPRLGMQKGKVNNCTYCTVSMEMRARGYDVQARSKGQGAVPQQLYSNMFKDFKMERPKIERMPKESRKDYVNRSYDNLCKEIEKCGNGARGYVGIMYEKAHSGHAMYWKVENNRVTFYDGQSGKTNPDKLFALADPSKHSFARLDNLQLKEGVTEAVVSKKSKGDK